MKHWHKRIQEARTWHELLLVVREYIASLEPHQWAAVPAKARPDRIKGIDDVSYWRERLEAEFLPVAGRADVSDSFRHMLGFFQAAADRAAEMYGRATPPAQGADNDGESDDAPLQGRAAKAD